MANVTLRRHLTGLIYTVGSEEGKGRSQTKHGRNLGLLDRWQLDAQPTVPKKLSARCNSLKLTSWV